MEGYEAEHGSAARPRWPNRREPVLPRRRHPSPARRRSDRWRTVASDFGLPFSRLGGELDRMQDPAQCDKITKINATLDETKEEVVRPQALAPLLTGYCRQRGSHTIAPWPFAAPLAGQDY